MIKPVCIYVCRTVVSGGGDDLDDVHSHRSYQVYRGMSPNTSNRLEVHILNRNHLLDYCSFITDILSSFMFGQAHMDPCMV